MRCPDCKKYICDDWGGMCECDPWISVKYRLPEQFDYILATDGFSVMGIYFQDGIFLHETKLGAITHWMATPFPPTNVK